MKSLPRCEALPHGSTFPAACCRVLFNKLISHAKSRSNQIPVEEPFVTLIQVAQETPDIRNSLLSILQEDEFNRSSMINTLMEEMRYKGAPDALTTAMASLLDDRVAQKAHELLKEINQPVRRDYSQGYICD